MLGDPPGDGWRVTDIRRNPQRLPLYGVAAPLPSEETANSCRGRGERSGRDWRISATTAATRVPYWRGGSGG